MHRDPGQLADRRWHSPADRRAEDHRDEVPGKDDSQIFRLPIDRAFTMKGFGTVVAGTLIAGGSAADDEVEILQGDEARGCRGIQVHGDSVEEARAGSGPRSTCSASSSTRWSVAWS